MAPAPWEFSISDDADMDRLKGYWDNWTNIEQEHKVLTLCTSKGVSAFCGIVCKGSLVEQGGVEQLVSLYQVRLVFIGNLGFHTDLIKVGTGHSRSSVQQKEDLEQGKKFRTVLLESWWPRKSAILSSSEPESGVDVLA